jgi:uncharacterized protein (DUF427 family)
MTESVWDYPRPPRVEESVRRVRVVFDGQVIADSTRALRVLETSHPPVYYIPPDDVRREYLLATERHTFCEFKGRADYYTIQHDGRVSANGAWVYQQPSPGYEQLAGYIAFYPSRVDGCFIKDEQVTPQPGDFYGGWITADIDGPFKGGPGTSGW